MEIKKKGILGILMALGLVVAACDPAPEGNSDDTDEGPFALVGSDCSDVQPAAGRCVAPNACNRELGRCLPVGSDCFETSDCVDGQMCDANFQCVDDGCGDEQDECARTEFDPGDGSAGAGSCVLVNGSGCCMSDDDCDVNVGAVGGVCDPLTNRCVGCLEHADCADDEMCDVENMVCRPVVCEDDPDQDCDTATINPETRACEHGRVDGCCESPQDDAACRTPCADNSECADGWECRAMSRASYCVPMNSPAGSAIGCSTDLVEQEDGTSHFMCTWCDDVDRDGICADEEICGDGRDNNGDGNVDEPGCIPPADANDPDADGIPTACPGEGACPPLDNCPNNANANQADGDGDHVGDVCDNCPNLANQDQADVNNNSIGDACEPPPQEVCNGVDDDGDDLIDEGNPGGGVACSNGVGACAQAGTTNCVAGQLVCDAVPGAPAAETCNNVDDDCDGSVDDNVAQNCYTGPAGTQDVGTCGAGVSTCAAGQWGACQNEVTPVAEICGDGIDQDCSGVADNGCVAGDPDGDGVAAGDICPADWNPAQGDRNNNGVGNVCDAADCALTLLTTGTAMFEYNRSLTSNVNVDGNPNAPWQDHVNNPGVRELCLRSNEVALLTAFDNGHYSLSGGGDPCVAQNIVEDNTLFRAGSGPANVPAKCQKVCTSSGPGWRCYGSGLPPN